MYVTNMTQNKLKINNISNDMGSDLLRLSYTGMGILQELGRSIE